MSDGFPTDRPLPIPLQQRPSAAQPDDRAPGRARWRRHGHSRDAAMADGVVPSGSSQDRVHQLRQTQPQSDRSSSDSSSRSRQSMLTDAKKWFDDSNQNPTTSFGDNTMDVDPPFYQKRDSSSADARVGAPLTSSRNNSIIPYALPGTSFLPPGLVRETTRSSSADDYRSVIDDLTVENKRLKEELKRYKQMSSRDVLEKERLFEIKVHGLPRRKKQELEATLRDFAASLGDSASSEAHSQRKREKSASSKNVTTHIHHHHHHHHHEQEPNSSSANSRSNKQASNSSSRSRPVDSAYASMSTGAHSSGTSLVRPSFGGPKARTSEQKVERYLQDIPEGLHPNYGIRALGDNDKKKLIVRRLEQIFTGKISGRYTRPGKAPIPPATGGPSADAAVSGSDARSVGASGSGTGSGQLGGMDNSKDSGLGGGMGGGSRGTKPLAATGPSGTDTVLQAELSAEPLREARIQARHTGHKKAASRDNVSTNSNSNGDESGNGNGNGNGRGSGTHSGGSGNDNGSGHGYARGNGSGGGHGRSPTDATLPEQRPTRPLDLDPDRIQVPSENMAYIRHLGMIPPEVGPQSVVTVNDVSPDADGWVYLNLLSNLAQLHIFNVASDFIRQAIVEKSTKFQLSPDGQKIRWRGGTDGTKFSSDNSTEDQSQRSQTTTSEGDGSDENGRRKKTKTAAGDSASALSSDNKKSKFGPQDSRASSSFQYKPLFVHRSSHLLRGEDGYMSRDTEQMEDSPSGVYQSMTKSNLQKSRSKSNSNDPSNSNSNSNSNINISRYDNSRSGLSDNRNPHRDGVLVYYSGMPFCTDLAGDSGGDVSPTTYMTSTGQMQDSMDEALQGRPSMHRSSSGSFIPFRPLTDYLSLSREEWSALGLFGIGSVGRPEPAGFPRKSTPGKSSSGKSDNMSSSVSYRSAGSVDEGPDDEILILGEGPTKTDSPMQFVEPFLEASGINRIFPEDHFAVHVKTRRPYRTAGGLEADDDDDDDTNEGSGEVFSMSSLMKRLAALKRQSAPISGAVARQNKTVATVVVIDYLSIRIERRAPVDLPLPAMFYPPFSPSTESEEDEDMLDSEVLDDEDESVLASSSEEMISRRANPHHSDNHASPDELFTSGEDGDVEVGEDSGLVEMDDSTDE